MIDKAIEAALRAYYEHVPCYADTRTRLRAAIAAYEQAMWRPIEEAPLDYKARFDVWLPDAYGGRRLTDCRRSGRHIVDSKGYFVAYDGQPSHYRPLPPPPVMP